MKTWNNIIAASTAKYGIACGTLGSDNLLEYNSHDVVETASTIKILIMICAFDLVEKGKLSLDTTITIEIEDVDDKGSGLIKAFKLPQSLSLYNAIIMMMSVSDNTATNGIIRLLGDKTINEYSRNIGLVNTRLRMAPINFVEDYDMEKYPIGRTTPLEMYRLLTGLLNGSLLNQDNTILASKVMQSIRNSLIARLIPVSEENNINSFGSKTGTLIWETAIKVGECGYIKIKDGPTYVFSIYSKGNFADNDYYRIDLPILLEFSDVAKLLYEQMAENS